MEGDLRPDILNFVKENTVKFIFLLLALAGPAIAADMVARKGKDSVRLTDAPCPAAIGQLLPPPIRELFRAASASVDGKTYAACFAMRPDGYVVLQYEDGDAGLVPMHEFKREPGV